MVSKTQNTERFVPAVSVIIPTYNRSQILKRAVISVLNQSYQDFEVIVVDDGSMDDTEYVIRRIVDHRLRYIKLEKHYGAAAARNKGIQMALGQFIAFQDSDDEWVSDKLQKQVEILQKLPPVFGAVYCRMTRIKETIKKYYVPSNIKTERLLGNIHAELLKGNFIGLPTAVIRRECFETVGLFDEQLERFQDWELFIRISKQYMFFFFDETLLFSYHSKDSITAQTKAAVNAMERILGMHKDDFRQCKRHLLKHYFFAFRQAILSRDFTAAKRLSAELIRVFTSIIKDVLRLR